MLPDYIMKIINIIYKEIITFYDNITELSQESINEILEEFKTNLLSKIQKENNNFTFYSEQIKKKSKLEYQYYNFEYYIKNIYIDLIISKFSNIKKYSTYNFFVFEYTRNTSG